jgi:hypothetical protein
VRHQVRDLRDGEDEDEVEKELERRYAHRLPARRLTPRCHVVMVAKRSSRSSFHLSHKLNGTGACVAQSRPHSADP